MSGRRRRAFVMILSAACAVVGLGGLVSQSPTAAAAPAAAPGSFVPLTPSRLLDTRSGIGAVKAAVAEASTLTLQVTGRGGVPSSGVSAVVLNVTVVSPAASGYLTVYPTASPRPNVSNLNFVRGQTVPNLALVPLGYGGRVSLFNGSAGSTQLLADVSGYYIAGNPTAAGMFVPVTPTRLLDTRSGPTATPLGGMQTLPVQVTGRAGVPSQASAVVLNLTVVTPRASGYITAFPTASTRPDVSNLNFAAAETVPNLAVVPIGSRGQVSLFNGSTGKTNMLADIAGYFTAGSPTDVGALVPVSPTRLLDTRSGLGAAKAPVAAFATLPLQATGLSSIPATAVSAVVLNVTVVNPTAGGYLTAYPAGSTRPAVSNLNFVRGQTVPNLVVAPVGVDGKVSLFNGSSGSTQLIADVAGYVIGPDTTPPAPVTALTAAPGGGSVTLSWTNPTDTDFVGVMIRRSAGTTPPTLTTGTLVTDTANTTRSYTDTGLSAPTQYSYALFAHDAAPNYSPAATATATTQRALSWNYAWVGATPHTPTGMSCVSATFCVALDQNGSAALYDGSTWAAPTPVSTYSYGLNAVSCASASFCMAVGTDPPTGVAAGYIYYGATHWTHSTIPGTSTATEVSCVTSAFCLAGDGHGGYATYLGNSTWTSMATPRIGGVSGFSCASATFCLATDANGQVARYDGTTWTELASGITSVTHVSCASATFCMAMNDNGSWAQYDGTNWSTPATLTTPAGTAGAKLACAATPLCLLRNGSATYAYDGATWTAVASPRDQASTTTLDCTSDGSCAALVSNEDFLTYSSGSWTTRGVAEEPGGLTGVACPTTSFCVAIGGLQERTFNGTSWTTADFPGTDGTYTAEAVSCPTPNFCVATLAQQPSPGHSALYASTFDGATWTTPSSIDSDTGGDPNSAVSCPTIDFCVAVTGSGSRETYRRGVWSAPEATGTTWSNVSCASPTLCAATTLDGEVGTFDGTTWTWPVVIDSQFAYDAVSCAPSTTFCAAGGSNASPGGQPPNHITTYSGNTWATPSLLAQHPMLDSISCVSAAHCLALTSGNNLWPGAYNFDGTKWTLDSNLGGADPSGWNLSCATADFCVATAPSGLLEVGTR